MTSLFLPMLLTIAVALPLSAASTNTLSGPLPPHLVNTGSPWLVTGDIEVPFGKKVIIDPGTTLLFNNFTTLRVEGQLIAEGTKDKPIIFTSALDGARQNDTSLIANPFDWNGIYIHKDAFGSRLKYCAISYSVFGIAAQTRLIALDPCKFFANGKSNLTVVDSTIVVPDNVPFRYLITVRDAQREGVSIQVATDPKYRTRLLSRTFGIMALLAGAGGAGYAADLYLQKQEKLTAMSRTDDPVALNTYTSQEWQETQQDRNYALTGAATATAVGLIGAILSIWSFTF